MKVLLIFLQSHTIKQYLNLETDKNNKICNSDYELKKQNLSLIYIILQNKNYLVTYI